MRTGQVSAALAQYETCKKILEKELGVEPSLETTALYERIRSARQTAKHNIPATSTEFVGRGNELAQLRERLANPACRLVTLTGLGGAGKTRLAQEVARAYADMFINGAWMIQLAAVDSDGLIPAIGDVFDFPFTKGDAKKQLLNYLRQKELLLVMDNFEHLLESSAVVAEILQAAQEVKILVTSRERLDVNGEWVVELPGLESGSMGADQLFVQSAKRVRAEIQVGEQSQTAVADICRLVGGLPLGIEIAAAWIRSMTVEAIRDEIQKSLDFLASSRRDVPERQRSLRAVFESSWARLNEAEQKTFAALSIFRGGFTREAAEAVAGRFDSLLDKSLVQRSGERFELHEVTRQFAEEKLSAKKKARNAHAAHFAKWASERAKWNERASFAVMRDDFENVRAAWMWAGGQKDAASLSGLALFTKRYLDIQGRYREGHDLMERALSHFGAVGDLKDLPSDAQGQTIAKLILYRALFLADMGKPDEVVPTLEECLS
ncbi:MAG: AAA family ATPase [Chloroflexi bacterium]|nr:AAA family ATPase [Chloroflexota bacterium]